MEDGSELRQALNDLGISQSELARRMKDLGDDRSEKNILRSIQRMTAGDNRVSGEMRALLGAMHREPKPLTLRLTEAEAAEIRDAAQIGGHRGLQRRLVRELDSGAGQEVTFTDEELGELIRYMTRYGSGGFQTRLRGAFRRSFKELLGPVLDEEVRG